MIYSAPKEKSQGVIYQKPTPYCVIKIKDSLTVVMQSEIRKMNSEWFDKVEVFKGQTAIDLYGEKAKDGAIVITIKEANAEEAQLYLNSRKE
ncbi:hypothetical protein GCM10023183_03780 [Nibribacter koreensis]|uniref:TonB-dependent receptor plug domain-containing protein n=2 Tax=Nibribacter koreensis TaxID=1084519 RepID=A0ABP8F799_9BACT